MSNNNNSNSSSSYYQKQNGGGGYGAVPHGNDNDDDVNQEGSNKRQSGSANNGNWAKIALVIVLALFVTYVTVDQRRMHSANRTRHNGTKAMTLTTTTTNPVSTTTSVNDVADPSSVTVADTTTSTSTADADVAAGTTSDAGTAAATGIAETTDEGLPPRKELKDWQTPLYYTDQLVDHFAKDTATWPNRYYVGEEYWKGPGYPIFVIMGGEGPVDEVLYPYVMDILAPKFDAYVLQTEHRFYGTSIPTKAGPTALPTPDEFRRLFRPDQAIEDYVRLIRHIQGKLGCSIHRTSKRYCPIITVGASYPGFLSAMMRFVHPEIVDIAYASSAPLKLYDQSMDQYLYFDHITNVTDRDSPGCKDAQLDTMESISDLLLQNKNMDDIVDSARKMGLCHDKIPDYIDTPDVFAETIVMMVSMSWADFNMDYHPPKDPTTGSMRACEAFKDDELDVWGRMKEYFVVRKELMADQPDAECYDLHWDMPAGAKASIIGADWSGMGDGDVANAWEFQCCRDLIIRTGFGPNSMMLPRPFDLDWLDDHCQARFGVSPEPYRMVDNWKFDDLVGNGGSYILFTNGLNDGWSPLSYTEDLSDTIVALNMPTGAHHSDLNHVRQWESCGTEPGQECSDVVQVQKDIPLILGQWIDDVKAKSHHPK